jgi:hypothetical protein
LALYQYFFPLDGEYGGEIESCFWRRNFWNSRIPHNPDSFLKPVRIFAVEKEYPEKWDD